MKETAGGRNASNARPHHPAPTGWVKVQKFRSLLATIEAHTLGPGGGGAFRGFGEKS